ncbi:MBL fold metallo-hydrolase [Micromonospora cremea]|uniref:Glyoxylase, beta-lactamase superfamily II n=1 Tax=Micromonospora cremea TaxID=709881 RepID=A0A1N5Z268_9ACTN|nr:MBL fold metallo-hydrolase [Micromonospora cremea]SIN15996.1 Glyoxylase, beta-lactamase superfamily II [Micromonospora cremea]
MGSLAWSTYVAPAKPVVSTDLPPGESREMWSPTSSTLIYGDRDAVLVDALLTIDEGRALADWVVASGRNLTTIYITHAHGDHFFGAAAVLERFPRARLVAPVSVVEKMPDQVGEQWLDRVWRKGFPDQIAERPPIAEPLVDNTIDLEGEQLVAVETGHTDTNGTSVLHVPSRGLVVAGDVVYNDVHLHLAEAANGGIGGWLDALTVVNSLRPCVVIAGHKRDGAEDDPYTVEETSSYLREVEAAAERTESAEALYAAIIERYPDRINRAVAWKSAHALKPEPG